MKVVHFESGLGNQMLDFVDYLLVKKSNPLDDVWIEKCVYEIGEAHSTISMWNGYELNRVFGLILPDIRSHLGEDRWSGVVDGMRRSEFWIKGWNFSDEIVAQFESQGLPLVNSILRSAPLADGVGPNGLVASLKRAALHGRVGGALRAAIVSRRRASSPVRALYRESAGDEYCGHSLMGMFRGCGAEELHDELLAHFDFPPFDDRRNEELAGVLGSRNSVAIHARRGDYIGVNGFCYTNGYFRRATRLMRRELESPIFAFFSDAGSVGWIRDNLEVFGLRADRDDYVIVDWNVGRESFRDMQLMSMCRNNIVTQSSFGWWGSFLNRNSGKIVVAPNPSMIATHWM